jgi:hypothetical protein
MIGDPAAERADAKALGCVVAGGDIVDLVFGRLVHDPLGSLTRNIGVETGGHGLVKLTLSAARDDSHRRDKALSSREDLGLSFACLGNCRKKFVGLDRLGKHPTHPGGCSEMKAEGLELHEPEPARELRRVAELEVAVEREVVGNQ